MSLPYRDFNDRCIKIRNKFGEQQDLEFSKYIDWSAMSPREEDHPYTPTGGLREVTDQASFYLNSIDNLLDFGASSSGTHGGFMRQFSLNYHTLDNDPDSESSFKSFEEIPEDLKFNGIIASHVLEHIGRDALPGVVEKLSHVLVENGIILAIIPNVYNWPRFIRDMDHKLPLDYAHVGAMFSTFNIEIIDSYLVMRNPKSFTRFSNDLESDSTKAYLVSFLHTMYGMHPAADVVIVGIKRG